MVYAFQQDVPITMEVYRQIANRLGETPPEGLIVHLVIQQENGLRYIDVWESREFHERFVEERLHPIVHDVLRGVGFDEMPPEPEALRLDVGDVWGQTLNRARSLAPTTT